MAGMTPDQDPFPVSDFDAWAANYDRAASIDQYPFLGYHEVLARIVELAQARPGLAVLDLGTGTGNLALPFDRAGCSLWCCDFSEPMLARARAKLPEAHFALHDLRTPLPAEFDRPFDRIVSAYVFHHFALEEKVRILRALLPNLAPGGGFILGDVAFGDRAALEQVKASQGDAWEDEFYWLADETLPALETCGLRAQYQQVSVCAGVFLIESE
jgi:putative AdoMet-dependent methyltransferase